MVQHGAIRKRIKRWGDEWYVGVVKIILICSRADRVAQRDMPSDEFLRKKILENIAELPLVEKALPTLDKKVRYGPASDN